MHATCLAEAEPLTGPSPTHLPRALFCLAPPQATRDRAKVKTEGGQIIRVEAHPIPGQSIPVPAALRCGCCCCLRHACRRRCCGLRIASAAAAASSAPASAVASCLCAHPPVPPVAPSPLASEHPRPRRVKGRITLVGDAAGYVTKCSGEASPCCCCWGAPLLLHGLLLRRTAAPVVGAL